jgi:hypothetical protein
MPLRHAYAPLRPEYDDFLFAAVGEEVNGIPLSTISMLTQLGFDPWEEAAHLASLAKREAIEQLAQIVARLPGTHWPADARGEIAGDLIELLPRPAKKPDAPAQAPQRSYQKKPGWANVSGWPNVPERAKLWLIGLILGAAVVVSVIAREGLPFGDQPRPQPTSTIEAPRS